MKHTIDATGKKLGRIATEAATLLMGKNTPDFEKHVLSSNVVEIVNAGALSISDKKRRDEVYKSYSGYPGGLKIKSMTQVIEKKGHSELVRIAVKGMLPKNKLQSRMMKQLIVTE